jgi:hypothetical protein
MRRNRQADMPLSEPYDVLEGAMAEYRCYLFNSLNRIERVVDFTAASDAEACEEADRLHAGHSNGVLELWRENRKVYCPGSARKSA